MLILDKLAFIRKGRLSGCCRDFHREFSRAFGKVERVESLEEKKKKKSLKILVIGKSLF